MKYQITVGGGRFEAEARNGLELDSFVQEALSWGTKLADIEIKLMVPVADEKHTMTKFRQQRGGYAESMATVVDVRTLADLEHIVNGFLTGPSTKGRVKVQPYSGIDQRNGWDTHIVLLDDTAVGFTDGPLSAVDTVFNNG